MWHKGLKRAPECLGLGHRKVCERTQPRALLWRGWLWADQLRKLPPPGGRPRQSSPCWVPWLRVKPATGNLKSAVAQISLSRIGEHAEKCELTNQCLNIHLRNRHYRQNASNDVVFLWLQLLEKTFSFKIIHKFHGSDLKVLELTGSSQNPVYGPNS